MSDTFAQKLRLAVDGGYRKCAMQLLHEGLAYPFVVTSSFSAPLGLESTAFQVAEERGDLPLLMHMAAKPGRATRWAKKFLACAGDVVDVPVESREIIRRSLRIDSLMGLEIFLTCGYELKLDDVDEIMRMAMLSPNRHLKTFQFCLAVALDKFTDDAEWKARLSAWLGSVFEANHNRGGNFDEVALVRTLLGAGADPNGRVKVGDRHPFLTG